MRKLAIFLIATFSLAGAVYVVTGQEPEQTEAPPAEDTPETPETPETPAPPVSDDVFIPSEEVQADEELAFPVNI